MAKAKVIRINPSVMLELSCEEAEFILDVMRKIGGYSDKSRRRHADTILRELRSAGVSQTDRFDSEGNIVFSTDDGI